MENQYLIKANHLYTGKELLANAAVIVTDGVISEIVSSPNKTKLEILGYSDGYIIPGMLDLHIHGAAGADAMDATPEALATISRTLAAEGVTGFLATTMTDEVPKIAEAVAVIADYIRKQDGEGARVLGINLEGPFLSPEKAGAQAVDRLINPDLKLFKHWQKIAKNNIKMVTVAPELPGAIEFIRYLRSQNIGVALGHTNADYETAQQAIAAGATETTHHFNAMPQLHHREPGLTAACLEDERVYIEVIADLIHVHPAILKLATKLKTAERIILISDAMRAKALADGSYTLGPQEVIVKAGRAILKSGALAGSTLRLNDALRNMQQATALPLQEIIKMVTVNPARQLGMEKQLGLIAPQRSADLVVMNRDFQPQLVMIAGKILFKK